MDIAIKNLCEHDSAVYVCFSCEFGEAVGLWREDTLPHSNHAHVEIDVDEFILLEQDDLNKKYHIESENYFTRITALVESINDSIVFIRLGNDVIQLEFKSSSNLQVGQWITIEAKEIHLYAFTL